MTYYSSKDVAYVFIDGSYVQGMLNTVRMKTSAVLADTTGLGDTWREMSDTGLRSGELEVSGFYEGTAQGTLLNTVNGTDRVVSVLLEGNTGGKRFYGFSAAIVSGADIGLSSDSVHTTSPAITVRGRVNHGYLLAPWTSRGAASNTDATYVDLGAAADAGRAYLNLGILTLGGYDSVTVTVRHCDTSGGTYEDHTSFTARTAVGAQTIALATTINRYVSIGWTWTGSGTGQSWYGIVGVATDTN